MDTTPPEFTGTITVSHVNGFLVASWTAGAFADAQEPYQLDLQFAIGTCTYPVLYSPNLFILSWIDWWDFQHIVWLFKFLYSIHRSLVRSNRCADLPSVTEWWILCGGQSPDLYGHCCFRHRVEASWPSDLLRHHQGRELCRAVYFSSLWTICLWCSVGVRGTCFWYSGICEFIQFWYHWIQPLYVSKDKTSHSIYIVDIYIYSFWMKYPW